ncbi:protein lin-52-like protein isoform 2, partial [Daubentonia madagascariensis]
MASPTDVPGVAEFAASFKS